jgi:sRNA-binding regulator protein Hfq
LTSDQNRKEIKQRARRLASRYHIAMHVAFSVARGEIALADAIRRNTEQHRANLIENKHGLSRSDAVQVARGVYGLDEVLLRNAQKEHLTANATRSILTWSMENEAPITLYLHGCREHTGTVQQVESYSIDMEGMDSPLPKLQIQIAKTEGTAFDIKDAEKRLPVESIERPENRFRLASKHLFALHTQRNLVHFETIEGLGISGFLKWIGRYEIGVEDAKGREVVVFRHAISSFRED